MINQCPFLSRPVLQLMQFFMRKRINGAKAAKAGACHLCRYVKKSRSYKLDIELDEQVSLTTVEGNDKRRELQARGSLKRRALESQREKGERKLLESTGQKTGSVRIHCLTTWQLKRIQAIASLLLHFLKDHSCTGNEGT